MITVGIDLAAEPANTAVALINWKTREVVTHADVTDARIVTLCTNAAKIGIDCPFGWPNAFVEFVVAHRSFGPTPPADSIERRREFAYRATDLWCREVHGIRPLSVSADRIAHAALRCAGLLRDLGVTDRSGADRAVETYPAGSLRIWNLYEPGYKRSPASTADRVLTQAGLGRAAGTRELSEHEVDALIAGITARLALDGLVHPTPQSQVDIARQEGWIALPTGPLEALSESLRPS